MTVESPRTVAAVAIDAPLDRLFDYLAEAKADDIGRRVLVPFGNRKVIGVIVALQPAPATPERPLKTVLSIDRALPPLPADILDLVRFAATYYQHPLGPSLVSVLPPALKRARFRPPPPEAYALTEAGRAYCLQLPARAPAQRRLADRLLAGPATLAELAAHRPTLRAWLKAGHVQAVRHAEAGAGSTALPVLTEDQDRVIRQFQAAPAGFHAWLLHGITGSGKTEVYLRLAAEALRQGRQVLLLVPEIHLTPQLLGRVAQRFPDRHLVSLHSGLSDGARAAAWVDCLTGVADIAIGTRLAVFAPLPRLGLVIVDEEHDGSFKQMEGLRYSARDVAVWRARQRDVPILLGSATPALETWHNAQIGRYDVLSLPRRAHAQAALPEIRLVDIRRSPAVDGLSPVLVAALSETLQRGEQSLIFINRRGFAPVLYCQGCGHISQCPRCAARLVLHRRPRGGHELRCHHCGLFSRPPEACPACGALDLRPLGQGTQKVEDALAARFPEARILRIDRDSTRQKAAFAEMRAQIHAQAIDILVGTQIVAKGHDFPNLTLVGIIGADNALMSTDFRAVERLFAQLMQVAGRAGRAERPGRVLIQTEFPHHPVYGALLAHDFAGFANALLQERRETHFPPFSHMALLRADAPSQSAALDFLQAARELGLAQLAQAGQSPTVTLFDPTPALLSRIANRERAQLWLQSDARPQLQAFLGEWVPALRALPGGQVRWSIDVDPLDSV